MNSPSIPAAGLRYPETPVDEINLLGLLDVVLEHRWFIAAVTAAVVAIGAAYVVFSTPIYRADILVQVEDKQGLNGDSPMDEVANLFEIRSPASAEMQILRSRLVVGQTVERLRLDIDVGPKYLPLIGRWLAKHARQPSQPGIFGFGGYVTGNESLQVSAFVHNPRSAIGRKSEYRRTLVKRGATLGANCTVICGTTIGEFAFVGAGAVVTRDVPAYALMVGVPARHIGWMSEGGERLALPLHGHGEAICRHTGDRYVLDASMVTKLGRGAP